LIVSGIFRLIAAVASEDLTGGTRVLLALLSVLSIVVGHVASGLTAPSAPGTGP
jgi:uncharacterized membrane protein HdeD (DUF308 family)